MVPCAYWIVTHRADYLEVTHVFFSSASSQDGVNREVRRGDSKFQREILENPSRHDRWVSITIENSFMLSKQCLPIEEASSFSVGQFVCIRCTTTWLHTLKPPTVRHQGRCTERSDYLNLNAVNLHCLAAFSMNSEICMLLRKCNAKHLVSYWREHSCHLSHNHTPRCGCVHIITRSGHVQLSWKGLGIVYTEFFHNALFHLIK